MRTNLRSLRRLDVLGVTMLRQKPLHEAPVEEVVRPGHLASGGVDNIKQYLDQSQRLNEELSIRSLEIDSLEEELRVVRVRIRFLSAIAVLALLLSLITMIIVTS